MYFVTVYVRDKYGQLVKCRALLYSASQGHFVTECLVQLLHLRKFKAHVPVQGINKVTKTMKSAVFSGIMWRHVVIVYHTTPRNTPEDSRFHQHHGGSLKSRSKNNSLCSLTGSKIQI
jgi:hypothetical protein